MLPAMLQTESAAGLPRLDEAQRGGDSRHRRLVAALLLFALAVAIVVALLVGASISAGAAGGCGGG